MSNNYSAEIVGFAERDVLGKAPNVNENKHKEAAGTLLTLNKSRGETHEDLHGNPGLIYPESLQETNTPMIVESNETTIPAISETPSPRITSMQDPSQSLEPSILFRFLRVAKP